MSRDDPTACDLTDCVATTEKERHNIRVPKYAAAVLSHTRKGQPGHRIVDYTAQLRVCIACRQKKWGRSEAHRTLTQDFVKEIARHGMQRVSDVMMKWTRYDPGPMGEPLPADTELEITLGSPASFKTKTGEIIRTTGKDVLN